MRAESAPSLKKLLESLINDEEDAAKPTRHRSDRQWKATEDVSASD